MRRPYYCPHCDKLLNPGTAVIFVVEHGAERELVMLASELGDYSIVYPASFPLELGALYTFCCPLCHTDLTSPASEKLVEIHWRTVTGDTIRVNFSRVYGEQATFVCRDEDHVERYGEDAGLYQGANFFGEARSDTDEG